MFKIKYNILVIIQIIFGILNTTLLIKVFGVSIESDAFLLSCAILNVLQLILTMPVFQFLQFYNDLKIVSIEKSREFYNYLLFFSLIYGIIACLIVYLFSGFIIKLFTFNIDSQRLLVLTKILNVSMLGAAFYTVSELNSQLLNAEMRFSLPYILSTIPNATMVCGFIYLIYNGSNNIVLIATAQALALFLCALVGTVYISKTIIKYKPVFSYAGISNFIKNSIGMQFGNSIYHIFFPVVLNNFLSALPQGFISYFYYARKIMDIINSFTIGPSGKILRSKMSKLFAEKKKEELLKIGKKYILFGLPLIIVTSVIACFVQPYILKWINPDLTIIDLNTIKLIFLSLVPWYCFMLIEGPYVLVNTMSKKTKILISINSSFIFIFFLLMLFMSGIFGIYSIGLYATIAQIFNYIWHRKCAINILNEYF